MPAVQREIPLFTLSGVTDATTSTHHLTTDDGLGLSMVRFRREPTREVKDVVMVVHGLTTSTDMFVMPEHYNLVSYLLDHGFTDVWTFDFRMSNRHSYNMRRHRFNMDDCALYDFPEAVARIREEVGPDCRIHVVCHCLGSVSFMMSLFGGVVTDVASVVSNSVALTPRVPGWSRVKLAVAPFLIDWVLSLAYVDPRASQDPGLTRGKAFSWAVSLFHQECDVPACHMLSLLWGTGWPALYEHDNLHDVTHERGGDLYGPTSTHYYRHVRKMVKADHTAVKYLPDDPRYDALPDDYTARAGEVETPILFMTGANNRVFTDSNIVCHERLERVAPGRHELEVFPGYGHQDVFMGKHNHRDVFPRIVRFLKDHADVDEGERVPSAAPAGSRGEAAPGSGETGGAARAEPPADSDPAGSSASGGPGLTFDETMAGAFALDHGDPRTGAARGRRAGTRLAMHATVEIPDVEAFAADPEHPGRLSGTVDFPPFGTGIEAGEGGFQLFSPSGDPGTRLMVYELPFRHDGQPYYLAGRKEVRDDPGLDLWSDTTTLYIRLHRGEDDRAPVVGAGILSLGVMDLVDLLRSMRATGTGSRSEALEAVGGFGRLFLGELWDTYGFQAVREVR